MKFLYYYVARMSVFISHNICIVLFCPTNCRWDWNAAGVGAALSEETEQAKKLREKEKEKEKKKRAAQRKKEAKVKEEEEVSHASDMTISSAFFLSKLLHLFIFFPLLVGTSSAAAARSTARRGQTEGRKCAI